MRVLIMTAAVLAAGSAEAQGRRQPNDGTKPVDNTPKADEGLQGRARAHSRPKDNPWGGARTSEFAKTPK